MKTGIFAKELRVLPEVMFPKTTTGTDLMGNLKGIADGLESWHDKCFTYH